LEIMNIGPHQNQVWLIVSCKASLLRRAQMVSRQDLNLPARIRGNTKRQKR
jgi:hypothetical protein